MSNNKTLSKLLLTLSGVLFLLITIELYLHFVSPVSYLKPKTPLPQERLKELLVQQSSIPGLGYELIPNKDTYLYSIITSTNSHGMRDDEPIISESNPPRRIVAIGDSFTFGYRVKGEDTYPNVLEKLLNQQRSDERFEVLNLGVGGYSTQQEAIALKHNGLKWDPELIIIGYTLNDPQIDPLQPLQAYFNKKIKWWQHFNILRLIAELKFMYDVRTLGNGDYFIYVHNDDRKWQSVVSGFHEISNSSREKDIPVLLIIFPMIDKHGTRTKARYWENYPYKSLHEKVANLAEENGFHVIDLYEYYYNYPPQDLKSTPWDHHPNELGHKVAAEVIFNLILSNQSILPLIPKKE